MDLRMPDVDGVTATERILAASPSIRIVVVTTYESDADILRAVEAGAAGYLLKDASRAELADAVRDAARGQDGCSLRRWADRLVRLRAPTRIGVPLLARGRGARPVAKGTTNAEIGGQHISEATGEDTSVAGLQQNWTYPTARRRSPPRWRWACSTDTVG